MSFEPAKSQLMSVSRRHTTPGLPQLSFLNRDVQKESRLKLLGVSFDSKLIWIPYPSNSHTRNPTPPFPPVGSGGTVYSGSCRCLQGVCQTSDGAQSTCVAWRGPHTHLNKLDRVQLRALKIIGSTSALQTLHARRTVAAATYMYKLKFSELAPRLRCLLPPPMLPPDTLRTRRQVSRARHHPHLLTNPLSLDSPNYLKCSFPYSKIDFWCSLQSIPPPST